MEQFWISLLGQSPAAAAVIFITLRFLTFLQEERTAREASENLKASVLQQMTAECHTRVHENTQALARTTMVLERVENHLENVAGK